MGCVTSDVIRGMSVTQFIGVGHIAKLKRSVKNKTFSPRRIIGFFTLRPVYNI